MLQFFSKIDQAIFFAINNGLRNPFFDFLMPMVSWSYLWVIPFLVCIWLFIKGKPKTRWIIFTLLVLFVAGDALNSRVLKPLVPRPRPYSTLSNVHYYKNQWVTTNETDRKPQNKGSFPSSHAVNAAAAAALLIYLFPKYGWPAGVMALLIGFSRVYLGVHYPADVLAGALIGVILAGLMIAGQAALAAQFPHKFPWLKKETSSP